MNNKNILRIVLTGGPMAGKSSVLIYLQRLYNDEIQIIPEIATIFEKNFFKDQLFFTKLLNKDLSKLFFNLQVQLESIYLKAAKEKGVKLIVCDRGLFDGAAYFKGNLEKFLIINNTTPKEICKRYDAIIWLETLIKTDKLKGFNLRPLLKHEEKLVLKISNDNLKHWNNHPNLFIIKETTLKGKKIAVLNIINMLLKRAR